MIPKWLAEQGPTPHEHLPYAETLKRDNLAVAERRGYGLHYWRRSLRRTRRAIYVERVRALPRFLRHSRARRATCRRRRAAQRSSRSTRAGPGEPELEPETRDLAAAVAEFVDRCGGVTTYDAVNVEMIDGQRWYPEDFYWGFSHAIDLGLIVRDRDDAVRRVEA